jgi:hypothetical protein
LLRGISSELETTPDQVAPTAEPAQALANRLSQICSDHALGDALLYALGPCDAVPQVQ